MMRLENWMFSSEKETHLLHLRGNVFESKKFKDNTFITTSRLVGIDKTSSGKVATTESGNSYLLGKRNLMQKEVGVKIDV